MLLFPAGRTTSVCDVKLDFSFPGFPTWAIVLIVLGGGGVIATIGFYYGRKSKGSVSPRGTDPVKQTDDATFNSSQCSQPVKKNKPSIQYKPENQPIVAVIETLENSGANMSRFPTESSQHDTETVADDNGVFNETTLISGQTMIRNITKPEIRKRSSRQSL